MFPILETARLRLRELTINDAEEVYACFSNDLVTRYYGMETMRSKEQADELLAFFSNSYIGQKGIRWGIERADQEGIIGTIGFNAWSPKHKRAEIGYELHPDHWRKGYIAEALSEVIAYGFHVMDLTRIGAIVFLQNDASIQLLTKMGFTREGILSGYMVQNGIAYDTYVYSLLKEKNSDRV
ncbi:GNAT family N-acetyltransferase [Paenibacillus glycanilyticus]|uniref:N-acetyltransferase YoaA n=1 Tax=Paenibacillus glycanilyticus TaxID=126569 RepID=A0ABQ6GHX8_9BACL|nr:GNAT family protein [Paenibacillus glycanilyticus]GLX68662.1 putative N-acetyltransferase YoaA [Paenibacillus glycanilyticus]